MVHERAAVVRKGAGAATVIAAANQGTARIWVPILSSVRRSDKNCYLGARNESEKAVLTDERS